MSFRAFVAIDVSCGPELEGAIAELGTFGKALKPVPPENVHITLKFLGEVSDGSVPAIEGVMRLAVKGVSPFEVRLVDIGVFPNERRPRVVWVGLTGSERLARIASALEAGLEPLGFPMEKRPFSAHLTLARVREGFRPDLAGYIEKHRGRDFGSFTVEGIKLKKSVLTPSGPIYSNVLEVPL